MTSPTDDVPRGELILYQTQDGRTRIECRFEDETIWLTQALMAELFQKDVRTINEHLVNLDDEGELDREATIRRFRIVRTEGNRSVSRKGTWTARLAQGSPVTRLVPASVPLARRAPRANVGAVVALREVTGVGLVDQTWQLMDWRIPEIPAGNPDAERARDEGARLSVDDAVAYALERVAR